MEDKQPTKTIFGIPEPLDRAAWGSILLMAACLTLAGAWVMDAMGLQLSSWRPLPVVSAVLFLKLGLFTFWPVIAEKGKESATDLQKLWKGHWDHLTHESHRPFRLPSKDAESTHEKINLWDDQDPRLDVGLFYGSVPTLVLNHEQKVLDWNPAFALVFGCESGIYRGAPIQNWYDVLDNFKRVSRRADKQYGEGILPLADRERATYISSKYGRMVFTRIMSPIIERTDGRTLGWTVVLNINSVNKRQQFFTDLTKRIHEDSRSIRYAAAFDGIYKRYRPYRVLMEAQLTALHDCHRILDVGCGTGLLSRALLRRGHRVTAVEENVHLLRILRQKIAGHKKARLVRLRLDDLQKLPSSRFDGAGFNLASLRMDELEEAIFHVARSIKPGGVLSFSAPVDHDFDSHFEDIRIDLESQGEFSALNLQFDNVFGFEERLARKYAYRIRTREELRALLIQAGLEIVEEQNQHLNQRAIHLVARKRSIL